MSASSQEGDLTALRICRQDLQVPTRPTLHRGKPQKHKVTASHRQPSTFINYVHFQLPCCASAGTEGNAAVVLRPSFQPAGLYPRFRG